MEEFSKEKNELAMAEAEYSLALAKLREAKRIMEEKERACYRETTRKDLEDELKQRLPNSLDYRGSPLVCNDRRMHHTYCFLISEEIREKRIADGSYRGDLQIGPFYFNDSFSREDEKIYVHKWEKYN